MTAAVRGTLLVIALLAGATVAVIASIATRTPAHGEEAQEFWRAEQTRSIPTRDGRPRARRSAAPGSRAAAPVRHALLRVLPFAGARVIRQALQTPAEETPAAFTDRAALPVPADVFELPRFRPLLPEPRPEPQPQRNKPRTRMLCIAAVLAAVAGAALISHLTTPQRGIAHG